MGREAGVGKKATKLRHGSIPSFQLRPENYDVDCTYVGLHQDWTAKSVEFRDTQANGPRLRSEDCWENDLKWAGIDAIQVHTHVYATPPGRTKGICTHSTQCGPRRLGHASGMALPLSLSRH